MPKKYSVRKRKTQYCKYCKRYTKITKNTKNTKKKIQKGSGSTLVISKKTENLMYELIDKMIEIFREWLEKLQRKSTNEYFNKELDNMDFFNIRTRLVKQTEKGIKLYLNSVDIENLEKHVKTSIDQNFTEEEVDNYVDKELEDSIVVMLPGLIKNIFIGYINNTFPTIYSRYINNIDPGTFTDLQTEIQSLHM